MRSKYRRYAAQPDQVLIALDVAEAEQLAEALERLMCAVPGKPEPTVLTLDRLILRAILDGRVKTRIAVDISHTDLDAPQPLANNKTPIIPVCEVSCSFCKTTCINIIVLIAHMLEDCDDMPLTGIMPCFMCDGIINVRSVADHFCTQHNLEYVHALQVKRNELPSTFDTWLARQA